MGAVTQDVGVSKNWVAFRPGVLDGVGRLLGSRCPSCNAHFFPLRQVCSRCLGGQLEEVVLSSRGTLYTYTVLHQAAPGFEVPLVLGYVDLPEGVRILGQIAGVSPEDVKIGMPVSLHAEQFGEDDQGRRILGYRFRPTKGRGDRD